MIGELTNHLWQSTLYAIAAGMLALAFRRNRAQVRYWLWLSASLKFLVPFSLLMSLGSYLAWAPAAKMAATRALSFTIAEVTQPFAGTLTFAPVLIAVLAVWVCGFGVIALVRLRGWLSIRAAVRSSIPLEIPAGVEIRASAALLEPGVVGLDVLGVSRPVLLFPEGIVDRLTPAQLEAVFAHELCHIRRRDNLTAALHMIVEAIFWFHPLVWWIGARLVEERELACDEEVQCLGNDPQVYAQGILNVCKFYVESPIVCVAGVTGSNLKKRMERIMENQFGTALSAGRKLLLATAAVAVLAVPVALGFLGLITAPRLQAQSGPSQPGANGVGYPSCLYCPEPQYTDAAREAKFQGAVVLQAVVQPDGHATNIRVVKGPGLGLEDKAIEAVKTWRFRPAVGPKGTPVATIVPIEVTFRLPDQKATPK
jgi:bla regulator protein BlaR1